MSSTTSSTSLLSSDRVFPHLDLQDDPLSPLLTFCENNISRLKRVERFVDYFMIFCQLVVGVIGGLTTVLTAKGAVSAIYALNTVSPVMVFACAVAQRVDVKLRRQIERENRKRVIILDTMLENYKNPTETYEHYIRMHKEFAALDNVYLRPKLDTLEFPDGIPPGSARGSSTNRGGARKGATNAASGGDD